MASSSAAAGGHAAVGDLASLPIATGAADIAVAFMSLQDVDDMPAALAEARRALVPGACLVLAIVHPINSAGGFEPNTSAGAPFVIRDSYFVSRRCIEDVERDGLSMRFVCEHRSLEDYARALEAAGFTIETLREVTEPDPRDRWSRIPLFLDLRARRRS